MLAGLAVVSVAAAAGPARHPAPKCPRGAEHKACKLQNAGYAEPGRGSSYGEAFWSVRPPGRTFGKSMLLPARLRIAVPQRTGSVVTIGWTTRQGTPLSDIGFIGPSQ